MQTFNAEIIMLLKKCIVRGCFLVFFDKIKSGRNFKDNADVLLSINWVYADCAKCTQSTFLICCIHCFEKYDVSLLETNEVASDKMYPMENEVRVHGIYYTRVELKRFLNLITENNVPEKPIGASGKVGCFCLCYRAC